MVGGGEPDARVTGINNVGILYALLNEPIDSRAVDRGLLLPLLKIVENCLDEDMGQAAATIGLVDLSVAQYSPPPDNAVRHSPRLHPVDVERIVMTLRIVNDPEALLAVVKQILSHDITLSCGHLIPSAATSRTNRHADSDRSQKFTIQPGEDTSQPGDPVSALLDPSALSNHALTRSRALLVNRVQPLWAGSSYGHGSTSEVCTSTAACSPTKPTLALVYW